MTHTAPVPLTDVDDAGVFGGKAAQLGMASRAGLPVPPGIALSWSLVDAVSMGKRQALDGLDAAASLGASLAVRSSGVGEDSEGASFAGQHESLLNVPAAGLADAVAAVRRSVHSAAARAYRERVGVAGAPRAGVVIQRMVAAEVAGVAFRPNPVSGADEVVVECAWGLGETVAGGLVVPEFVRMSPEGAVFEHQPGMKDQAVVPSAGGGTEQQVVPAERAVALCLDRGRLTALCALTEACRDLFGGPQDLEWAFAGGKLWLLQRRAVTSRS